MVELGCDLVKWEPADLTAKEQDASFLEQWWWSSEASTGLVEVAPCESLVASRPINVAPPQPWKTPFAASSSYSFPSSCSEEVLMGGGYMPSRYIASRATTPAPIDIEVDDLVVLPPHDDSDDDDDAMRLFDAELDLLDDPRASLERDVGVSSLSWDPDDDDAMGSDDEEMIALKSRLAAGTPIPPRHEDSDEEDESSDIDEDSDDDCGRSPHVQHARPMLRRHILPASTGGTVSPQEVTSSLFEMSEDGGAALQLHKPSSAWTGPARHSSPTGSVESDDTEEEEMEMVVISDDVPEELEELAESWTTPLNLAKRRMALYL